MDDNPDICATVQMMLEYLGYGVVTALGGVEALGIVASGVPVDVIILDVDMPDLDGHATLARLRQTRTDLPVILCSGLDPSGDVGPAHALGPTSFLLKPYTFQDLSDALDAALAG
ncbi:MAG: response regulator [Myxococcota bacterium]